MVFEWKSFLEIVKRVVYRYGSVLRNRRDDLGTRYPHFIVKRSTESSSTERSATGRSSMAKRFINTSLVNTSLIKKRHIVLFIYEQPIFSQAGSTPL